MRRRFLLLIIVLTSILFVSCTSDKSTKTIEKLNKLYNESNGYETILEMKIINDDKESIYKMKEKYSHDHTISLEILEPKESQGIIIEYKDDKIFLNHASIRQSISLKAVKNFDKGILLANFFDNLDLVQFIEEKELDGKDYFVIEFSPEDTNKYNTQRLIYLTKKNLDPYLMEIMDENGNVRVKIKYEEFKYTEDN
ncbi:MAG: hypothetical protein GX053_04680 [Tissierella sp.]|nr:hypothetical protein [Tissierella sp.]